MAEEASVDYSLGNPDTLTKYKEAAAISKKVLETVSGWCTENAHIIEICERGDKLLDEEIAKVYKGKKISKGISHPCTVSPSSFVTPYTPLKSDPEEASSTLKKGELVKVQLGAQIDGFGTIVCDNVVVGGKDGGQFEGRTADLLLATHYANEALLRLMVPAATIASTEEEKKTAESVKMPSQTKINQVLEKIAKAYDVTVVESTTCWQFERNEIEGKKKIILSPGDGVKGEGLPEVSDVWGVEVGLSLGNGKVKTLPNYRATLHRRTTTQFGLKRASSRSTLSEIVKKFGTFPFSMRQLEDERAAKIGVMECVRANVLRQYEVVGDAKGEPVSRLFSTVAITKNGLTKFAAPPAFDPSQYKSDKKITDDEVLKILEQPIAKDTSGKKKKNKKKKKKPAKKADAEEEDSDDDSSDE